MIFNLCDGDEESRFEMVRFAKELETLHKPYTGSSPKILQYCKDKTLKWMKSCPVPKYCDTPPTDPRTQKFLTKPREAHGSLLITEENINGTHNFSPKDYFFQEYLEGPKYTTVFINNKFLGQTLVKETGILTRDDKWEPKKFENTERIWDLNNEHLNNELPNKKPQGQKKIEIAPRSQP